MEVRERKKGTVEGYIKIKEREKEELYFDIFIPNV
jgi:hypothetical protein